MIKKIKIFSRFNMENFLRGMKFPYKGELWHLISIYGDGDGEFLNDQNKKINDQSSAIASQSSAI